MIPQKQVDFIRDELASAKNPLFLFDGDADGLGAFLLLYRLHREGGGIPMTSIRKLDKIFARKVVELNPDKVFILDIPIVEQEFIDIVNRPIFWLDHHQPLERTNVYYVNPRLQSREAYFPTTAMAYLVSQRQEDLWIAVTGCLADWYAPDYLEEFAQQYPDLLSQKSDLKTMVYHEKVGELVKLFFFLLKGPLSDIRKSVKIMTRIKSPYEILRQESSPGKFLYKRFEAINKRYQQLLQEAKKYVTRSPILFFSYLETQWSFTANLANELTSLYPTKVVIVARKKSGEVKCSLRAQFPILPILEKSLVGINGYGGGHENACGAVIKEEDWDRFFAAFKMELKQRGR